MLYPERTAVLAQHLSNRVPERARRRRRELLGAVLESKAAIGAFDLELLHHWLDVALSGQGDRALFGLCERAISFPHLAAHESDTVSERFPREVRAVNSTTPHSHGSARAR
jgi:hypothetical protein